MTFWGSITPGMSAFGRPKSEVMAFYMAKNPELTEGKVVVELGGGMTCLSGLVTTAGLTKTPAKAVHLTDGNEKAVKNVERILQVNLGLWKESSDSGPRPFSMASCRLLRWDQVDKHASDLKGSVDIILGADCLFFDDFRQHLVDSLRFLLAPKGVALMFAPRRKTTFQDFCDKATASGFNTAWTDDYDPDISERRKKAKKDPAFNDDLHYPLLLKITQSHVV